MYLALYLTVIITTLCSSKAQIQISDLLPNRTTCGRNGIDRILGGTSTNYDEFPWLVMLQYRLRSGAGFTFSCGGALISSRYVLTAAHCVSGQIAQKVGPLVSVRLGEYDIRTQKDCTTLLGITDCNEEPTNVAVEEIIPHDRYDDNSNNRYHDIALLRLITDVEFTDFVQPICLPYNENANVGEELWAAGWGRTENASFSPVKLKVSLPVSSHIECRRLYKTLEIAVENSQLCAGGSRNKDTCRGDSGGPLMGLIGSSQSQWYVEGVVSFGRRCGVDKWPGVYTKVSAYLEWIYDNIKL